MHLILLVRENSICGRCYRFLWRLVSASTSPLRRKCCHPSPLPLMVMTTLWRLAGFAIRTFLMTSCTARLKACVLLLLCVCVLSQMLGAPITVVSLLTSADMLTEPLSEDFCIQPAVPDLGTPSQPLLHIELQPSHNHPVFATSVFHPPLL